MKLNNKTASELSALLKNKECSSVEIAESFLEAAEKENPEINAYISITGELALEGAKKADAIIKEGKANPLTGIPVAIKDNINVKGVLTTCGSKMLSKFQSVYDATVVEKMNTVGLVTLGKTNLDEFAIGTSGESSFFGAALNVWDKTRTPGGSSSGSAAAVAAKLTPLALGSDTGGSIRVPSSYCGVVGLNPTYGSVSRYGAVPLATSFDQIGALGRSVKDVAMLYDVIKGSDIKDATSLELEVKSSLTDFEKPLAGIKIGITESAFTGNAAVTASVMNAAKELEKQGAILVNLSMSSLEHAISAYYIISSSEISSNLGRYDGVRFGFRAENYDDNYEDMFIKTRSQGFGRELQKRIMVGTFVLTEAQYEAFYLRAKGIQHKVVEDFNNAFNQCDIMLTPTTMDTAFAAGKYGTNQTYNSDTLTAPVNLAGLPALSVPCGLDDKNLPIGMQLIGKRFSEPVLFSVANHYEQLIGGFPAYDTVGGSL